MIWDYSIAYEKHGSGPGHGKDNNAASKDRRKRSYLRLAAKKDRNVAKSSHGVFLSVADFNAGVRQ